jgi:uncharacterized protein (TIGR02118 family)
MIKLVFPLHRLPELSREQFQTYWSESHAPLVAQHTKTLGTQRYVQLHTSDTPINETLRASRDAPEPFDGIAELWFKSQAALAASMRTPEGIAAGQALLEDERRFIDLGRSPCGSPIVYDCGQ